jgi:hypothetical protein
MENGDVFAAQQHHATTLTASTANSFVLNEPPTLQLVLS